MDHLKKTTQSDLLKLIPPEPVSTKNNPDGEPVTTCVDCGASFNARAGIGFDGEPAWAQICLDCKRAKHHHLSGFSQRYQRLSLKECIVHEANRDAIDAAQKWVASDGGSNLWFYGSPGTGKTHIAAAAMWDGPIGTAQFVSCAEMLLDFQGAVKEHEELSRIGKYKLCGSGSYGRVGRIKNTMLFDDVGAHRVSPFTLEMFGILLDHFYGNNTTGLIFTSNLSPRQILDTMGERISSRLRGLAQPIKVDGRDMRLS